MCAQRPRPGPRDPYAQAIQQAIGKIGDASCIVPSMLRPQLPNCRDGNTLLATQRDTQERYAIDRPGEIPVDAMTGGQLCHRQPFHVRQLLVQGGEINPPEERRTAVFRKMRGKEHRQKVSVLCTHSSRAEIHQPCFG
jgi:hypothetical protein